ncbi:MAG: 50S ribosomal protein L29 [Gammaproteobacteria bacterium]|nr:50S ribosomal protein L29 [Gammaproteobacteria bacterium]
MKSKELRVLEENKLKEEILALQKQHFVLRMQKKSPEFKNTAQLKIGRRSIARAKTILREKDKAV